MKMFKALATTAMMELLKPLMSEKVFKKKGIIKENQKAKDFKLRDTSGKDVKLSDYKGKYIILYFYPRDDTPGCTIEAKGFKEDYDKYEKLGAVILGVSGDNESSHKKFCDKYGLPFTLLCDTDFKVSALYNAYGEKSFMGKKSLGIFRKTYVIDKEFKIIKIFDKVNVNNHSKEILELLK